MAWTWLDGEEFDAAFRGFEDDEKRELEMERRTPLIDEVAQQLTSLRGAREQRRFCAEDYPDEPEDFESDADRDHYELRQRLELAKKRAEEQVLLSELTALGARMMRPYEHWNEEERLMQYLEGE